MSGVSSKSSPGDVTGFGNRAAAWVGPDEREQRLIDHFAQAMHAATSGDWGAAGWETQQRFRSAALDAVARLNKEGLDLLDILPKGARGRV